MGQTLVLVVALWSLALVSAAPPRAELLEELEALASSEPPLLGIDTQWRTGEVLARANPKLSRRFLSDALSRTQGLADSTSRGSLIVRISSAWVLFDARAAEDACKTLTRRMPRTAEDFLADCYGALISRTTAWPEKVRLAREGLAAGAFDTGAYAELLKDGMATSRQDALSLYTVLIDRFPEADANAAEIRRLLSLVRIVGIEEPALSRQALERALRALRSHNFPSGENEVEHEYKLGKRSIHTGTIRDALLFQIAAAARTLAPDLLDSRSGEFQPWAADVRELAWSDVQGMQERRMKAADEKESGFYDAPAKPEPKISKLSFDDAVEVLRKEKDPYTRVAGLLELVDREAEPLSRRKSLATEALESSVKMVVDGDRLIAQSMLTRRFWIYGDKQQAALAASYLSDTFRLICRCEDATCDSFKGREYCPEQIRDFAEYLRENKVSAAELGLSNPSLRARLLLLELEETIKR